MATSPAYRSATCPGFGGSTRVSTTPTSGLYDTNVGGWLPHEPDPRPLVRTLPAEGS
jgi:hypothetical protein